MVRTNTLLAPAATRASAQAETVAPVVKTSSTSRIFSSAIKPGMTALQRLRHCVAPAFGVESRLVFLGEETRTRLDFI